MKNSQGGDRWKKGHSRLGRRNEQETHEALIFVPQAWRALKFFLQHRDLTRSIFYGKPLPQLTCRAVYKYTPGFLGTPAGITTKSQPFRQSGSCSGPR